MTTTDDQFRVGDPVRVKNIPGPRMIITGFSPDKNAVANVHCKWFDRRAELQGEWLPAKMLCRVAPWIERPGYRAALEMIRAQALADPEGVITVNDVLLVDYIDDILAHTHASRIAESTEPEAEPAE